MSAMERALRALAAVSSLNADDKCRMMDHGKNFAENLVNLIELECEMVKDKIMKGRSDLKYSPKYISEIKRELMGCIGARDRAPRLLEDLRAVLSGIDEFAWDRSREASSRPGKDPKELRDACRRLYLLERFLEPADGAAEGAAIYEVLRHDGYGDRMAIAHDAVRELADALGTIHGRAYMVRAIVESPVVAGRGFMDLVTEYGLAWDPVLDLPYIPASELKGAIRSLLARAAMAAAKAGAFRDSLDLLGKARGRVLAKEERDLIGGLLGDPVVEAGEEHAGWIVLTDAYPVEAPGGRPVELLVLTPHYTPDVRQEYEVRPKPVRYVGIARGTALEFAVGVTERGLGALGSISGSLGLGAEPEEMLKSLISDALGAGVGRRTSRGMGRMRVIEWRAVG
jgi:CRISPR type III-B/RAMP module RAMP protein Cmr6